MAAIQEIASLDMVGEEAKLTGGAAAFAFEPRRGQAGFPAANIGNRIAARVDFLGDPAQERGTIRAACGAETCKGVFGGFAGGVYVRHTPDGKAVHGSAGWGVLERRIACNPLARDKVVSSQQGVFSDYFVPGYFRRGCHERSWENGWGAAPGRLPDGRPSSRCLTGQLQGFEMCC